MEKYEVVLRLLLAIAIGGGIGYERQSQNRPAGFRTHILVCVGAAVISLMQLQMNQETINMVLSNPELVGAVRSDMARMSAQVVSGIGFLGAGTIMHEKGSIKGLTTAATVWVVGCIGLAVGYGYYWLSIVSGICVIMVLVSLKKLESNILSKGNIVKIDIRYYDRKEVSDFLRTYFNNHNIKVKNIEYALEEEHEDGEHVIKSCMYTLLVPKYMRSSDVLYSLLKNESIFKASIV